MRVLLDTHAFLWWVLEDPRLSPVARETISDPDVDVLVSPVSAWEIAIKAADGRLDLPEPARDVRPQPHGGQRLPRAADHDGALPAHRGAPRDSPRSLRSPARGPGAGGGRPARHGRPGDHAGTTSRRSGDAARRRHVRRRGNDPKRREAGRSRADVGPLPRPAPARPRPVRADRARRPLRHAPPRHPPRPGLRARPHDPLPEHRRRELRARLRGAPGRLPDRRAGDASTGSSAPDGTEAPPEGWGGRGLDAGLGARTGTPWSTPRSTS